MKKHYFIIFIFIAIIAKSFGQNNTPGFTCSTANAACAGNGFSYPNVHLPSTVTAEAGINYGCLGSQPRPTWFYFQIATSGPMSFHMAQGTTVGQNNLDVDYICWGPFTAPTCGATSLNGHIAQQQNGTNACSFSAAATEDFTLNAVAGQYYMLMITNYAGGTGFITLSQTNNAAAGAGSTNCDLLCPLSITGGNTSTCANTSLTANYLNSVINPTGPTTTFSWTYLCTGCTTPPVPVTGSAPIITTTPRGTKSILSQPLPAGTYSVTATSPGCLNPLPATTVISPPIIPINQPINLFACTGTTFDLTSNTAVVIAGLSGSFAVKYHQSLQEAIDSEPFIGDPSSPLVQNPLQYVGTEGEVIWMSIKNTGTGCSTTASFVLHYNSLTTPLFNNVNLVCSGTSLTALPTTSNNGIIGTWSPELNNTETTTYTFTPTAEQCATTSTQTITISNPLTTSPISFVAAPLTSVSIGTQIWTTKNLDVTTYRDGTPIPEVTDPTAWANLTTGAWCYYNNDQANGAIYGKLYNWYAVVGIHDNDPNTPNKILAPLGWHVPSDEEWTTLYDFLGGTAGGRMKEMGTTHWAMPNTDATNSSGFKGLPGGYHSNNTFYHIGQFCYLWSSSEDNIILAWGRGLHYNNNTASSSNDDKTNGYSVRCVKN